MSNVKTKKTVKLKENDLVDLIDKLVTETLVIKKKEWLAEQAKKATDKTSVLESRILALEKLISKK
jgi:hypothetical protein